ncbi:alpha-ketoglutarate-dependent dioxygenase alkB homolog 7, mitochondrial isoform X2 [Nannospalax galili]|uniref:alpha-ketoglutarate-dependent dioxygenase alkB homolog 7, mitochondrial isoform X2 n=1 Tax=Nannospalax galili TaxID=1026970 RepID=UPI00111C3BFF|nr:alpha-ketoglutarate-dependent dioxygenase alkB homolog 7, mitochondrial isoform X2 [Nannospalax galili]
MAGIGWLALRTLPGCGWVRGSGPAVLNRLRDAAVVRPGFLSQAEADTLSREVDPELRRRRYEYDHWDAFCGSTIAGLSLLSPSVMKLVHTQDPAQWLELLLEPGSLYILRGPARYDFSHEILRDEESFFGEHQVPRGRRISVICRSIPEGMGLGRRGHPPPA